MWVRNEISLLPKYRVTLVVKHLGWVHLDLACSPGWKAATAAQAGRWNIPYHTYINPTKALDRQSHPVKEQEICLLTWVCSMGFRLQSVACVKSL